MLKRRPISLDLRKIKISDIRTVNMLSTLKDKYFYADNSEFIPQVRRGMPHRTPIPCRVLLFAQCRCGLVIDRPREGNN